MTDQHSILVAVDLAVTMEELAPVVTLAQTTGWKIELLHAAAPEPAFVGYDEAGGAYDEFQRDQELSDEYEQLSGYATLFTDLGIEAEAHVIVGPTIEVLLANAEAWGTELIAVVGRRHTVAHRLVLGSAASTLLKVASLPVLVLPTADRATDPGFRAAVEGLIDLIDRDTDDERALELREAAEAQLAEPDSEEGRRHLWDRAREAVRYFETDHPSITRAINDVSYYLSGMGI